MGELQTSGSPSSLKLIALAGVPLVETGDDLCALMAEALRLSEVRLQDGDVVVIAQKIVSKAHGRLVELHDVDPSPEAHDLATEVGKPPELVELILRESVEVVRKRKDVLVVAQKLGFVIANAGIDQSNVRHDRGDSALLLPEDPDATCEALRAEVRDRLGVDVGLIISDSHGRAFRNGTVGVAIGSHGIEALKDLRGRADLFSRRLQSTEIGLADEIASAASLLMGQADEGRPIVVVRGLTHHAGPGRAADLVRPKETDLFRDNSPSGLIEALQKRRTIRRYTPALGETDGRNIERIIEAGASAPSAHNRQPWRFAVLKSFEAKHRLASAMGEQLRHDRGKDGDPSSVIEEDIERSYSRITNAPVVIIACMCMDDMDRYRDERRSQAEYIMAVQSTAMAIQNMQLMAHALGLGSSIMCAPLFCASTVRSALGVPDAWEPQALLTIGKPDDVGKPFVRRPTEEIMLEVV